MLLKVPEDKEGNRIMGHSYYHSNASSMQIIQIATSFMLQWKETNKQTTDQLKPGSLP
jgi:hypothetical protein